jgi:cystathionine beta-lyase
MENRTMCAEKEITKEWDFDEIIDRSHTGSVKWEPAVLKAKFGAGRGDLLAMWVADMDFKCPDAVRSAMEKRVAHQIYGYTITEADYYDAVISWFQRRHNWSIHRKSILTSPGVVPATSYLIQRFSKAGDKVLIQTPVYYPFAQSIEANGRSICDNPLQIVDGCYQMDFEDLEKKGCRSQSENCYFVQPAQSCG